MRIPYGAYVVFSARARLASMPACAARRALHRSNARYANSSWHLHVLMQPLEAVYTERCESSPPFPSSSAFAIIAKSFEQIQWIHNCTASFLAILRRISPRRHDLRPSRPCIGILLVEQPGDS
ncbi:hypothetical protein VTO73DRAFT_9778 [Trametes versicolor]